MLLYLSVLGVLVVIMLSIFSKIDNWQRDWTTNFAKLDPASEDPQLRPQSLELVPEEVSRQIRKWAESKANWTIVSHEESAEGTIDLHLTRTTPLLRFTDDIKVHLEPSETGTTLTAESQSRIGKGDLGQNPRNLKAVVQAVTAD